VCVRVSLSIDNTYTAEQNHFKQGYVPIKPPGPDSETLRVVCLLVLLDKNWVLFW